MPRMLLAMASLVVASLVPAHAADIESLERQLEQARDAAPMVIKSFTAISKPAEYFGNYEPRKSKVFRRGEKLYFYGEPKNIVFAKNAKGLFELAFDVDMEISGPGDTSKKMKMMTFRLPSRSRVQDIFLNLSLSLDNAPVGSYKVRFIVRDLNSKKTAAVDTDVTIE
jgi:hypothetical protein